MNGGLEPFWGVHKLLSDSSSPRDEENATKMSEGSSEVGDRKLMANFFLT